MPSPRLALRNCCRCRHRADRARGRWRMVARRVPALSVRIPTVGRHRGGLPEDLARVRVYRHHTAAKRAALVGVGNREDLLVGGDADLDDVSVNYRRSCDDRHLLIVSLGFAVRLPVWRFSLCADYNPVVTTPALKSRPTPPPRPTLGNQTGRSTV
jgi:hypothetical protein